ncbi:hypothetical protein F5888DRAFT_815176 [Russula emetica]|nr:hypothetical protein F5888DRAFT_815176 [Russula emetica]
MAALSLNLVPCWIRKARFLDLKCGLRQLGVHHVHPLRWMRLEITQLPKCASASRSPRQSRPGRRSTVSAQRLSDFFHLLQQLLHVVLHVLQNRPLAEAAISLSLSYGQDMSAPRMAHLDLAIMVAQFFARLRHGIIIARHYRMVFHMFQLPRGQCGALDVNYGHSGSLRHNTDGNSVLRESRTGLRNK